MTPAEVFNDDIRYAFQGQLEIRARDEQTPRLMWLVYYSPRHAPCVQIAYTDDIESVFNLFSEKRYFQHEQHPKFPRYKEGVLPVLFSPSPDIRSEIFASGEKLSQVELARKIKEAHWRSTGIASYSI